MKKTLLRPILLLAAVLLAPAPAHASEPNTLSDAEQSGGWHLLFDGHSLAGWRSLADPDPGAGWKVIDGCIVRTAHSGDLVTIDDFGDFELSIEWKVEDATNSGILYRVSLSERQTFFTGPEYQILDNVHGDDRVEPKHRAGALYDLVAPKLDNTRPVGTWNTARIVVRGWHVEHWMNGEKIVDIDLDSPEGRQLKMHSKFASMPSFAAYSHGHIALQDHTNSVSYRNIKIRELPAAP
jgi:hypothetical protein